MPRSPFGFGTAGGSWAPTVVEVFVSVEACFTGALELAVSTTAGEASSPLSIDLPSVFDTNTSPAPTVSVAPTSPAPSSAPVPSPTATPTIAPTSAPSGIPTSKPTRSRRRRTPIFQPGAEHAADGAPDPAPIGSAVPVAERATEPAADRVVCAERRP